MSNSYEDLNLILNSLVNEGKLSSSQADLILEKYATNEEVRDSRSSVLAEIAGYLGGVFVVIATTIATANKWDAFTQMQRGLLFGVIASALFVIGFFTGLKTPVRARLSGLMFALSAGSAAATTAIFNSNSNSPIFATLVGSVFALIGYYYVKSLVGHIVLFGFISILGLIVISDLLPTDSYEQLILAAYLFTLGIVWTYFTYKNFLKKQIGYFFGGTTLFTATQVLFFQEQQLFSYLTMALVAVSLTMLYIRIQSWPLVFIAVLTTTVGVGEFVAGTLGGSLGGVMGLFAAGTSLVISSLFALRNKKRFNENGRYENVQE